MHMVTVGADFKERNFVTQGDLKAHFLEHHVHIGVKDRSPIFGAANNMVQKNRDVMALADEGTHALR
jgi:hypothetical protein